MALGGEAMPQKMLQVASGAWANGFSFGEGLESNLESKLMVFLVKG